MPFSSYDGKVLLSGIIYLHKISDTRVGGVARRNFAVFRKLCGEPNLKNALLVTNMWTPNPSSEIAAQEAEREEELASNEKFFKKALECGAQLTRHDGSIDSAHKIARHFLRKKGSILQIQRELVDDKTPLANTQAGGLLRSYFEEAHDASQKDWQELKARQNEEIAELRAGYTRLEEMLRVQAELHRKETEVLQETIAQLTANLAETTEALQGVAQKLAQVTKQTEVLSGPGDTLERRVREVVKQAYADVREFKRRQGRTHPRQATAAGRLAATPPRRASIRVLVQPAAVEVPQPAVSASLEEGVGQDDGRWGCVIQ